MRDILVKAGGAKSRVLPTAGRGGRQSLAPRLVLLCYIRSGWNEANTNENDHWITLWSLMGSRAIRPDRKAGSADHRFCGPRLFGPVIERSNSCARVGGHSHAVDDQTAAGRFSLEDQEFFLSKRGAGECSFFFEFRRRREHRAPPE